MINRLFAKKIEKQVEKAVAKRQEELQSEIQRAIVKKEEYEAKLEEVTQHEIKLNKEKQELVDREDILIKGNKELSIKEQELNKRAEELEIPLYLDECGIYNMSEYFYQYNDSNEYKQAIKDLEYKMKQMIKDKTACSTNIEWRVNDSVVKGRQHMNNHIRMALRLFNKETDILITSINTRTNLTNLIAKIKKCGDLVNDFSKVYSIELHQPYIDLKIQLAKLVYEQVMKKQEEKEEARRQAEIIREQEKLEREIAKEREKLAKEVKQYQTEIDRLYKTVDMETGEINEEVATRLEELENKISEIQEQDAALEERIHNKAGWVYIITNDHMGGCKIGVTRRMNAQDRIDELGSASVPFRFNTNCVVFSEDAFALENQLHKVFHSKRINKVNNRKEFFSVTTQEIEEYIKANIDSTVKFLHDIHDSEYLLSI